MKLLIWMAAGVYLIAGLNLWLLLRIASKVGALG
jgi:hypothetical protein